MFDFFFLLLNTVMSWIYHKNGQKKIDFSFRIKTKMSGIGKMITQSK